VIYNSIHIRVSTDSGKFMEFEKKLPGVMEIMEFGGRIVEIVEFSLLMCLIY